MPPLTPISPDVREDHARTLLAIAQQLPTILDGVDLDLVSNAQAILGIAFALNQEKMKLAFLALDLERAALQQLSIAAQDRHNLALAQNQMP